MVFRYGKSDSEVFFPVRVRVRQLFSGSIFLQHFLFRNVENLLGKILVQKFSRKVGLARLYARKCGFSGIIGNAGFFYFWSGGKYLGMLYQRGMGSDPLKESFLYWRGLIEEGPIFFWRLF